MAAYTLTVTTNATSPTFYVKLPTNVLPLSMFKKMMWWWRGRKVNQII